MLENYAKAIYGWLSQFATTYREPITEGMFDAENTKPTEYITYSADMGNFGGQFIQAFTIYSTSTAWTYLMNIVDKIEKAITEHGIVLRYDWGIMRIEKGSPFYQDKPDEDSSVRAGYINLLITIYQKGV